MKAYGRVVTTLAMAGAVLQVPVAAGRAAVPQTYTPPTEVVTAEEAPTRRNRRGLRQARLRCVCRSTTGIWRNQCDRTGHYDNALSAARCLLCLYLCCSL